MTMSYDKLYYTNFVHNKYIYFLIMCLISVQNPYMHTAGYFKPE